MFLHNLKNIYTNIQHNNYNLYELRDCTEKLKADMYRVQVGGEYFMEEVRQMIIPKLNKLHTNIGYLEALIKILNAISEKLKTLDISKVSELEELNNLITEMKKILESRIAQK